MDDTLYAFPQSVSAGSVAHSSGGMTLRDAFAIQAMAAIIAKSPLQIDDDMMVPITVMTAKGAFNYADAMIAERTGGAAIYGWVYNGPDGEWYWAENPDGHESVTQQRPATSLEKCLMNGIAK